MNPELSHSVETGPCFQSPPWWERLQEDAALRAGGPHRFQACDGTEDVSPAYLLKNREKNNSAGTAEW